MILKHKLQKLTKTTIERLRADGEPIPLDHRTIAVGNYLIIETSEGNEVKRFNKPCSYNLGSKELAVAVAKLMRRNAPNDKGIIDQVVDLDCKISSKKFDQAVFDRLLKSQPDRKVILQNKAEQVDVELVNLVNTARNLIKSL